jgi:tetratricopeptide (TPR) repeat protein
MSKVAQLKKKAAELELKKQFDKALAIYVEILDGYERNPEEVDVALFNRVGDLMLRLGNVADAIDYYERAVDLYAEGGFFNNAIALCNKILRQVPGRASVYYKLGKISAQKGFKSDAKRNFLEYADRMQKANRLDEAFRALKEFADLCPDQDDIRLMLAEQLSKQERTGEAIEQLQTLYERYTGSGREAEARATIDRMRAIDPKVTPRATGGVRAQRPQELVFLDLNEAPNRPDDRSLTPPLGTAPEPLGLIEQSGADASDLRLSDLTSNEFERIPTSASLEPGVGGLEGLEKTGLADESPVSSNSGMLLDIEPTSLGGFESRNTPPPPAPTLDPPVLDALTDAGLEVNLSALDAAQHRGSGEIPDLLFLDGASTVPGTTEELPAIDENISLEDWRGPREVAAQSSSELASPIDGLPLMDLEVPHRAGTPISGSRSIPPDAPAFDDLGVGAEFSVPERPTGGPTPDELRAIASVTPSSVAPHTRAVQRSVQDLHEALEREPSNAALRRELGEALLEAGHRDEGLDELERAMTAFERANDLDSAASLADEIVRANPGSVRLQQKRVEYAFRMNDKPRLVEAYLDLASALLHGGQADKARAVYQRVLDLHADEPRALAALSAFAPLESTSGGFSKAPARDSLGVSRAPVAPANDFVNLGDMLRDEPAIRSTRMVVEEHEPTGDEEADFADMLRKFKQGIAENVGEEDHQSHYDLGIAFKEMGLVDEAIAEFQKALRSPTNRVPTYESLGQCFVEKEQYQLAATVLGRALNEPGTSDEALVGVLYLLGRAAEAMGRRDEALVYYHRVFVLDIQFRDVARRISDMEQQKA